MPENRRDILLIRSVFFDEPAVVVTLDALERLLLDESGKIAAEDVPGLMANLCAVAARHPQSDAALALAQQAEYAALAYCGDCENAPCVCNEDSTDG